MTCRSCNASTRDTKPYPCCGQCGAMLCPDAVPQPPDASAGADVVTKMLDAWYGDVRGLPPYDSLQRTSMKDVLQVAFSAIRVSAGLVAVKALDPHCWARNMQTVLDTTAPRIGLQPEKTRHEMTNPHEAPIPQDLQNLYEMARTDSEPYAPSMITGLIKRIAVAEKRAPTPRRRSLRLTSTSADGEQ